MEMNRYSCSVPTPPWVCCTRPSDCQCLRILENYIFRHFWTWLKMKWISTFPPRQLIFALIANDLCHDLIRYYCLFFGGLSATIASTTPNHQFLLFLLHGSKTFFIWCSRLWLLQACNIRILFVEKDRKKRRTRRKPLAGWIASIVRVVHLHLTKDICTMIASLRRWIMADTRKPATATLVSRAPLHIHIRKTRASTVFVAAAASGSATAVFLMLSLANISRRSRNDFMHRTQISFHGTRNFGRQRPTISPRMCDCVATRPERRYLFAFWVRHTHTHAIQWTERREIFLGLFVLRTESSATKNSRRHRWRVCLCSVFRLPNQNERRWCCAPKPTSVISHFKRTALISFHIFRAFVCWCGCGSRNPPVTLFSLSLSHSLLLVRLRWSTVHHVRELHTYGRNGKVCG